MDAHAVHETLLTPNAQENVGDLRGRVVEESKKIWRIATPGVVARVSAFGTIVVTQAFFGHVSSVDLAAYALVQTLTFRFVNGVLLGMSSATETLCGQAFGAKQYHMMGIYLQRSWLIDLITFLIMLPLFVFCPQIFKLLGQDEELAKSAGYISLWFIPFVLSLVFSFTMQMYLQAQQRNMVVGWLAALRFAVHILCSWLFVYVLDFGVDGAMAALSISSWFLVSGEFVYIFCGWCPDTWKGFDFAAFKDLWPLVKLSVSSGLMMCLELWYYAILVLVASYMKNARVAISAFSICLNVVSWITMIFLGLMGAACVRVANELGKGDAKAVKFTIKVLMATSISMGAFFWILCMVFRNRISYFFTDDEAVAKAVSELSLLLAFSAFLASIYPVLSGVAIGSGLQTKVAMINLVCFYLIGLPIGIVLGYVFDFQIQGIWVGLTCGVVATTLAISFLIWRTDWDREVLNTCARLKRWNMEKSDEDKQESVDAYIS